MTINLKSLNVFNNINNQVNTDSHISFSIIVPITASQTMLNNFQANIFQLLVNFNYYKYELHFVGIKLDPAKFKKIEEIVHNINQNRSTNFLGGYFYQRETDLNIGDALEYGLSNSSGSWIIVFRSYDMSALSELHKVIDQKRQKMINKKTKIFEQHKNNQSPHSNKNEFTLMKKLYKYNLDNFGDNFRIYPKETLINCFKISNKYQL